MNEASQTHTLYVRKAALAVWFPFAFARQNPFFTRRTEPPGQYTLPSASAYRITVPSSFGHPTSSRSHGMHASLLVAPASVPNLPAEQSLHGLASFVSENRPASHGLHTRSRPPPVTQVPGSVSPRPGGQSWHFVAFVAAFAQKFSGGQSTHLALPVGRYFPSSHGVHRAWVSGKRSPRCASVASPVPDETFSIK